jgi:hypothetical protein
MFSQLLPSLTFMKMLMIVLPYFTQPAFYLYENVDDCQIFSCIKIDLSLNISGQTLVAHGLSPPSVVSSTVVYDIGNGLKSGAKV